MLNPGRQVINFGKLNMIMKRLRKPGKKREPPRKKLPKGRARKPLLPTYFGCQTLLSQR